MLSDVIEVQIVEDFESHAIYAVFFHTGKNKYVSFFGKTRTKYHGSESDALNEANQMIADASALVEALLNKYS
jgi:hypothetical protein